MRKIEICAATLESALNAQKAGADRIELCSVLPSGGVTPSYGAIRTAREHLSIDMNVLVRPRPWDFVYSDIEVEEIVRDIEMCAHLKANGVVVGALTPFGEVDRYLVRDWIRFAHRHGLTFTFHRAIDRTRDMMQAVADVVELGADRILSSGGCANAYEGRQILSEMVKYASRFRTIIMPGAGIRPENIALIAQETAAPEFHLSASASRKPVMKEQGGIGELECQIHSDAHLITLAREQLMGV